MVPCNAERPHQQWSFWHAKHLTDPQTEYWMGLEAWTRKKNSLYCIALLVPWGAEPLLARKQHTWHMGIFACDEAGAYSSAALDLGGGARTHVINIDLHCPIGGKFNSALNTVKFQKFWDQVIADGRWRFYDWTVKADIDAVFVPWRLTDIVRRPALEAAHKDRGMYIQNCQDALHGPVEVFSRKAVDTFARSHWQCRMRDQEDWYMADCMTLLGVPASEVKYLLADKACSGDNWSDCATAKAAFHPFKDETAWTECWTLATKPHGAWS